MGSKDVLGIFVGGRSRRMGGFPKGLLRTELGETLVEQHVALARELNMEPVLVGARSEYASLLPDLDCVPDANGLEGPIAGLRALLAYAQSRTTFAVACDMPRVDRAVIEKLQAAHVAPVTAARVLGSDGKRSKWNPFPARYRQALPLLDVAIAEGARSFQAFFRHASVQHCDLQPNALVDADTPDEAAFFALRRTPVWSAAYVGSAGAMRTTAL